MVGTLSVMAEVNVTNLLWWRNTGKWAVCIVHVLLQNEIETFFDILCHARQHLHVIPV